MSRFWKWVVCVIAVLGIMAIIGYGAVEYYFVYRPIKQLEPIKRLEECILNPEKYSNEEVRKRVHTVLRVCADKDALHDAFLLSIEFGNAKTVPLLIEALKKQPETQPEENMGCTKGHCLEALWKLTGHHAGPNYADWKKWPLEQSRKK